ncbi:MAG: ASCH domain-containing protein [Acidobacteriota bacterium]
MNAITLIQPWAWFVVHGFKQWETRSWQSDKFGPLAIHASKKVCPMGGELYNHVRRRFGDERFAPHQPPRWDDLPRGAVVGKVLYNMKANDAAFFKLDELEFTLGDFSEGRWLWRMKDPIAFENPKPCKGMLGVWWWDEVV